MSAVILVSGMNSIDPSLFSGMEQIVFIQKNQSPVTYRYDSLDQLRFELKLRSGITEAAKALSMSNAAFATFEKSRCNPFYWNLTEYGGFALKGGVMPAAAIRDIFINGYLYAFECATAMVIVLYKAVLDTIGDERFNHYFANLLLRDWHYDKDLGLITINVGRESYPGDILYFKNPDVHPDTPEWQGENVVKLGDNFYYGHGIGLTNAEGIITALNTRRRPGSTQSAYLMEQATFPDFNYLYSISGAGGAGYHAGESVQRIGDNLVKVRIGHSIYIAV